LAIRYLFGAARAESQAAYARCQHACLYLIADNSFREKGRLGLASLTVN
jgi:hypothetical protein